MKHPRSAYVVAALSVLLTLGFLAASCSVDTDIPKDILLSCVEEGDCPGGWTCDVKKKSCLPPGVLPEDGDQADDDDDDSTVDGDNEDGTDWRDVPRAEDKEAICLALYPKLVECQSDVEARLPQAAAIMGDDEDSFVYETCIPVLLDGVSDDALDDLMLQKDFIPLASCTMFTDSLCSMLEESDDFPSCTQR